MGRIVRERAGAAGRTYSTTRRRLLRFVGAAGVAGVAGCSGGSADDDEGTKADSDVVVGPDGHLRFEPETVTAATGDVVKWYFDSSNHNVSCRPGDSSYAKLPDGAEPFSSYPADASSGSVVEAGGTFEHAFAVAGTYVYACIPHQRNGMVGRVVVE